MAATKATKAEQAAGEVIRTIHGEDVPASELAHIAPHLRPFAVRVDSLKQDPNNARKHVKKDLASTAASLDRFGQQDLIHFDPKTRIVKVGNGRHGAAHRVLEWTWIAAAPSNLTGDELRAFALAHNRTAELSEWDMTALQKELDALEAAAGDGGLEELKLEEMGFGEDDLADLEEESERKAQNKQTAAEAKTANSVEATMFQVVISCNSERHQTKILKALEAKDVKELIKQLTGVDVRARSA